MLILGLPDYFSFLPFTIVSVLGKILHLNHNYCTANESGPDKGFGSIWGKMQVKLCFRVPSSALGSRLSAGDLLTELGWLYPIIYPVYKV